MIASLAFALLAAPLLPAQSGAGNLARLAEIDVTGPVRDLVVSIGSAGESRLLGELLPGERMRITLPLPARDTAVAPEIRWAGADAPGSEEEGRGRVRFVGWKTDLASKQIEDLFPLQAVNDPRPGPATRFKFADGAPGGIGFISSVSQAFCTTCNRIRLTAEGGLRTCLFSLKETPLRDLMRSGVSDEHLGRVMETAVWRKEEGHLINQPGFIKPAKNMSQIGG